MPIDIDPNFSVYRLVERVENVDESAIFSHRRTMNLISNEIENATLVDNVRTRVFSSFQRLSRFLPQIDRYRQLARTAESVYVFGVPDIMPPAIPNVTYVPLKPNDQLAKEWFLVSYGKGFVSALATEELTHIDDPDPARMFKGLWTFDLRLIAILEEWLSHTVNAADMLIPESEIDLSKQARLVNNIMNRLLLKVMVDMDSQRATIVQGELKTIIKETIYPLVHAQAHKPETATPSEQREAIILFSDLRNFTQLAESMDPRHLVENIINPYLSTISRVVYEYGGVVDKFLGDGVLAVFYAADKNTADNVVKATRDALQELRRHTTAGGPHVGIGLASGPVLVGQIGSELRHEETVIGDAVNTAQRLSSLGDNDAYLSYTVYERLQERAGIIPHGEVPLKGKADLHRVYRLS